MKTPLRYQATEADCGKTSLTNAFLYLFEREEIAPQLVDYIARVTGDCNLGLRSYYRGTSGPALAFMAAWCNDYLSRAGMPVRAQALLDDEVSLSRSAPLARGLAAGAVAVCGCSVGVDHYVLMTGLEGDYVRIFDPYYEPYPPESFALPAAGVSWVDAPFSHNRLVSRAVLDDPASISYSLHARCGRDAILLWRTSPEPYFWH
jgi:hypothetical protein